jgi:CRISPR system Cascade subunit CasB
VETDRLASVAGVIAHTRLQDGPSRDRFAQQLASDQGGRALVSGLRFRRLLAEDDPERLYGMMVRMVRHLDGNADLGSLASGLYWWNQETKKRWAQDYYERAPGET